MGQELAWKVFMLGLCYLASGSVPFSNGINRVWPWRETRLPNIRYLSGSAFLISTFLSGDVDQVHARAGEGDPDLCDRQHLHGGGHALPPPLGRDIRVVEIDQSSVR